MPDGSSFTRDRRPAERKSDARHAIHPDEAAQLPPTARHGRGATCNPGNRFESTTREDFDDGWSTLAETFAELPPLPTTLTPERSRSAMAWNESPDIGFDRSLNPYRGCEHGCVYCYARPSHAYLGLSPGLDFETRLFYKPDMPALLEKELSRPGYVPRPVALGANTDPYQPVERTVALTRRLLEVLERFSHPVTIVTKSAGVLRDMDILGRMSRQNLVQVCMSVTTLDPKLARIMEPRAAAPTRRLAAMRTLADGGIPVGVLAAPMIPGLNDAEMERILEAAQQHGAVHAGYVALRLPLEIAPMFENWLLHHMPDRARKILALVRDMRAGALYDSRFGVRQSGTGAYAELMASRFALAMKRLGLDRAGRGAKGGEIRLDCSHFKVPGAQLALF
ncbi:MAG: radical protein [Rhodospirillales bacterium]|jgi:DNA repair photolyase|nr:radical protein [Rhodospirillales bacterium]